MIRILFCILFSTALTAQSWEGPRVSGMTLIAPPDEFAEDPFPPLVENNVKWIGVVPYSFIRRGDAKVQFGNANHQWWGETPEGVKETIRLAKIHNLNIMLKPQVWIQGSWVGEMDYETEEEWAIWENSYREYILAFAKIAQENEVEIFCIGTEFKIAALEREGYWRSLIREVRDVYCGSLTYCSNWDHYDKIPFWKELDMIGISAYFPLTEKKTPTVKELVKLWKPVKQKLEKFSEKNKKPILFAEYGYLSIDGCAGKTWELEQVRTVTPVNEQAQANALEALYTTFYQQDFWAGCVMWKWWDWVKENNDYMQREYTPRWKKGEIVLRDWYAKLNNKIE